MLNIPQYSIGLYNISWISHTPTPLIPNIACNGIIQSGKSKLGNLIVLSVVYVFLSTFSITELTARTVNQSQFVRLTAAVSRDGDTPTERKSNRCNTVDPNDKVAYREEENHSIDECYPSSDTSGGLLYIPDSQPSNKPDDDGHATRRSLTIDVTADTTISTRQSRMDKSAKKVDATSPSSLIVETPSTGMHSRVNKRNDHRHFSHQHHRSKQSRISKSTITKSTTISQTTVNRTIPVETTKRIKTGSTIGKNNRVDTMVDRKSINMGALFAGSGGCPTILTGPPSATPSTRTIPGPGHALPMATIKREDGKITLVCLYNNSTANQVQACRWMNTKHTRSTTTAFKQVATCRTTEVRRLGLPITTVSSSMTQSRILDAVSRWHVLGVTPIAESPVFAVSPHASRALSHR